MVVLMQATMLRAMYTVYDDVSGHTGVATAITRRHLFTAAHNVIEEDVEGVERFMRKVCLRKPGSEANITATCVGGSIKKDWVVLKLADGEMDLTPAPLVDGTPIRLLAKSVTVYSWNLAQTHGQAPRFAAKPGSIFSLATEDTEGTTFEHNVPTFAGDSGSPVVLESGLICGFHVFEFNMLPQKKLPRLSNESDFINFDDDDEKKTKHKKCKERRAARKESLAQIDELWATNKKGLDSLDHSVLEDYLFAHGRNEKGEKPELLQRIKEFLTRRDEKAAAASPHKDERATKRLKQGEFDDLLSRSLASVNATGNAVSVQAIFGKMSALCQGENLVHSLRQ